MADKADQAAKEIYHRLRSTTQPQALDQIQVKSGQVCGRAAWGSHIPSVKAYPGPLPSGASGIEFTTDIKLSPGRSSPSMVKWYRGDPGVIDSGPGLVCIPVAILKVVP